MAKSSVFWLNNFPANGGVSEELSPRKIVTGQKLDYKQHCRSQFGEYMQMHEEHNNSMIPHMVGGLALCPTGNAQDGYYFMSLPTGCMVNLLNATPLPMPDDVVNRINLTDLLDDKNQTWD